jgi:hypothetical protein
VGENLDGLIAEAIRLTAADLAEAALKVGAAKIGEKKYMQPALLRALTNTLESAVQQGEPHLRFEHWQGLPGKRLGGIDIAIHREVGSGYRAFLELKWGDLDWAILDFFKMTTARVSPAADNCYLIAGEPLSEWKNPNGVGELFRDGRWRSETVLLRHRRAWIGDGTEFGKLTHLPRHIITALVADERVPAPLDTWTINAIRVEPEPLSDRDWLPLVDGQITEPIDLSGMAALARRAHGDQHDGDGRLHVEHCERVAEGVEGEIDQATALLHDVLEDTDETSQSLRDAGVPEVVVQAVEVLTKRPGERYAAYLARVADASGQAGDVARAVKVADLNETPMT